MMDHMRQHDWCSIKPGPFVDEVDLDNCATERILRNKFFDPLISSDDEQPAPIDWEAVFKKRRNMERNFKFIPGFHKPPLHPKLSSLTSQEHYQCIKVLSSQNPHVKAGDFMPRPVKGDFKLFEKLSEKYAQEQKEYIEWAKTVWVTANCIRALRPKPLIENVYEAEFKMKMHMIESFPKLYTMAAQIPIRTEKRDCEIVLPKKDLIEVNISELPEVEYPAVIDKKISVLQPCPLPERCTKHPCKFKLPTESTESILPLTEIHEELAQYALDNGCQLIASEGAVRSLLRLDTSWSLPMSVCQRLDADGNGMNVVVLSSEVPTQKDLATMRTYKAYRHLLVHAFTSMESNKKAIFARGENHNNETDKQTLTKNTQSPQSTDNHRKSIDRRSIESTSKNGRESPNGSRCSKRRSDSLKSDGGHDSLESALQMSDDSSSDDDRLLIDIAGDSNASKPKRSKRGRPASASSVTSHSPKRPNLRSTPDSVENESGTGILACTCKGTEFETPRPRSYRKWKIKRKNSKDEYNIIIHCSHKLRSGSSTEVVLEPTPEYQLEIGGTLPSADELAARALALLLRRNTNLIDVRVDGPSGEVVTIHPQSYEDFCAIHGDWTPAVGDTLHTAANQLAGLLPGHYQLHHEVCHGANAMLYTSRGGSAPLHTGAAPPQKDEAKHVQAPPHLGPVLLPYHKARRQLPCAFTANERQVARESHKPPAKTRPPPKALTLEERAGNGSKRKWPKKKRGKNKK